MVFLPFLKHLTSNIVVYFVPLARLEITYSPEVMLPEFLFFSISLSTGFFSQRTLTKKSTRRYHIVNSISSSIHFFFTFFALHCRNISLHCTTEHDLKKMYLEISAQTSETKKPKERDSIL